MSLWKKYADITEQRSGQINELIWTPFAHFIIVGGKSAIVLVRYENLICICNASAYKIIPFVLRLK